MDMYFSDKIINFLKNLQSPQKLPPNVRAMNPYLESEQAMKLAECFYTKYYNDQRKRKFILGINPGRFGAGLTGIPFTDTKRLSEFCDIEVPGKHSHEPSSVFVYQVIQAYGGLEKFYADFYINSLSPLGFIRLNEKNNWVNYNYYDSAELFHAVKDFMISSLRKQLDFGLDRKKCYVLGKKNHRFIQQINEEENFFDELVVLKHPRYIVQYQSSAIGEYVDQYIEVLSS